MQSTPKSRRGRYCFICLSVFVVLDDKRGKLKTWHVLTKRAWVRGVGIDFLLQSCCCWCYVIQPVHHVLHECVVGCPILSSIYEHAPIYHLIVLDSTPSYTLCAQTSQHRVRCSSAFKQLAKHHWHVTNTPCKAPQKAVEGATALFVCLYSSSWMISVGN